MCTESGCAFQASYISRADSQYGIPEFRKLGSTQEHGVQPTIDVIGAVRLEEAIIGSLKEVNHRRSTRLKVGGENGHTGAFACTAEARLRLEANIGSGREAIERLRRLALTAEERSIVAL